MSRGVTIAAAASLGIAAAAAVYGTLIERRVTANGAAILGVRKKRRARAAA